MLKKILITVSFILISAYGIAQKTINNYKYIIVPKKFEVSKSDDQYQLNSLTKFLFNKYGFEAYFTDEVLPEDLSKDRCLALSTDVVKQKGGMFKTKVEIVLKDCYGVIVMTSQIGESRKKEYDKAYTEALRDAFQTFQSLDYKYVANQESKSNVQKQESVAEEIVVEEVIAEDVKTATQSELEKEVEGKVEATMVQQNTESETSNLYYAQSIKGGYQLVDSEPKVVMILLTTAAENVFLVKDKNAIVFKEDGFWYYSHNNGEVVDQIPMNIKF